uniref:Putative conserved protein with signal anchor n=1 Tax=Ixodes ricinus TaxID=34613 RepID=A0A6B0V047_IXORI
MGYQLLVRHLKRRLHPCLLLWPPVRLSTQARLSRKPVCLFLLLWQTGLPPTRTPMNCNQVRLLFGCQLLVRHLKRRLHPCLFLWPPVLLSTQARLSRKPVCFFLLLWPTGLPPTRTPLNCNRVRLLFAFNHHEQDKLQNVTMTMCENSRFFFWLFSSYSVCFEHFVEAMFL